MTGRKGYLYDWCLLVVLICCELHGRKTEDEIIISSKLLNKMFFSQFNTFEPVQAFILVKGFGVEGCGGCGVRGWESKQDTVHAAEKLDRLSAESAAGPLQAVGAGWRGMWLVHKGLRHGFLCVFPVCQLRGQSVFPVCDGCQAQDPDTKTTRHEGPGLSGTGQAAVAYIRTVSLASIYTQSFHVYKSL